MASFNVQNNPYYKPFQGNNWLADRLVAAMQSFSRPRESGAPLASPEVGPPSPTLPFKPAGFGSALLGNDANRMNQAYLLRQGDVNAAREPFQAEVAQENASQGRELDARAGNVRSTNDAAFARMQAENEAAAARQAEALRQRGQESTDQITDNIQQQALNRGNAITLNSQNNRAAQQLRETPQPMSAAERIALSRPVMGSSTIFDPRANSFGQFNPRNPTQPIQWNPGGWSKEEQAFLNEDASSDRTVDRDMSVIDELLKSPNVPTNISY